MCVHSSRGSMVCMCTYVGGLVGYQDQRATMRTVGPRKLVFRNWDSLHGKCDGVWDFKGAKENKRMEESLGVQ